MSDWNASQLGQSLGLSYHTVNSYLDYLSGAFLIRKLPSYQANIRKRLVKSPRIYWRDTGNLHAILNVSDEQSLITQPWVGASWEGFVIEQAIGLLASQGVNFEAYYFRTSDQYEVDLLLDFGTERWAVEIKLTASPKTEDMELLDRAAEMIGASRRFLVSKVSNTTGDEKRASCNLSGFLERLGKA